ncbi:MAG: hypothetical protein Q9219_004899 [cf. Caloplaca sp. 3 TL-2023]
MDVSKSRHALPEAALQRRLRFVIPNLPQGTERHWFEVQQIWDSIKTIEPVSLDTKRMVHADLKEAWHFYRVNAFHHGDIIFSWHSPEDSGRLVLDDCIGRMSPMEVYPLLNKSTVFYILQSAQFINRCVPTIVFDAVFQEWIRCYKTHADVEYDHFLANLVRVTETGPSTIPAVIAAHHSLCAQASNHLQRAREDPSYRDRYFPPRRMHGYSLFPLYHALVVIVDTNWYNYQEKEPDGRYSIRKAARKATVLITRTGVEEGLSAPISFAGIQTQSLPGQHYDAEALGPDTVRVSVVEAVRFLFDLEQREKLAYPDIYDCRPHDKSLDPLPPKGYEDSPEVSRDPQTWADAVIDSAEKYGYDNVRASHESVRRVWASLSGDDYCEFVHHSQENRYKY